MSAHQHLLFLTFDNYFSTQKERWKNFLKYVSGFLSTDRANGR